MEESDANRTHRKVNTERPGWIIFQSTTPPLIYRLKAMVEWAGLPLREAGDEHASRGEEEMKTEVTKNKEQVV